MKEAQGFDLPLHGDPAVGINHGQDQAALPALETPLHEPVDQRKPAVDNDAEAELKVEQSLSAACPIRQQQEVQLVQQACVAQEKVLMPHALSEGVAAVDARNHEDEGTGQEGIFNQAVTDSSIPILVSNETQDGESPSLEKHHEGAAEPKGSGSSAEVPVPASQHVAQGTPRASLHHPSIDAPRIMWTYWDQGASAMPPFNKLCVETWRATNPTWRIEVVDRQRLRALVEPEDLPPTLDSLKLRQHRADCAKMALLLRYGGMYLDSSILVFQDLAVVTGWTEIEQRRIDFAGYYLGTRDFVENWFLASRRGCPFFTAWHRAHLEFWSTRKEAGSLEDDPFFKGVNLKHIKASERNYLVQHACYKKLQELNVDGFRVLSSEVRLSSAADALFLLHRLDRIANERAKRSSLQSQNRLRTFQFQARVREKTWLPGGHAVRRDHNQFAYQRAPAFRSVHQYQIDVQKEMQHILLWEESAEIAGEVERKHIPFLKFTGHTAFLTEYKREDFFKWKNTMTRFFLRALEQKPASDEQTAGTRSDDNHTRFNALKEEGVECRTLKSDCNANSERGEAWNIGSKGSQVGQGTAEVVVHYAATKPDADQAVASHTQERPPSSGTAATGSEHPKFQEEAEGKATWRVIGGEDVGGIIVRTGCSLNSPQARDTDGRTRVSTGALLKQVHLQGVRLHYQLLSGTGPATGWISIQTSGRHLVSRE